MPPDEIKMKPETAIGVLENLHYQIKDQLQYAHHNAFKTAIEALEKQINGDLVEVVRCKDCKHSQPEDKNRVYCTIKCQLSNNKSFCEAMERK